MRGHVIKKGFTIIEVVLILAIAGLIFLMVFVALPALQRAQRDAQRRNDAGIIAAAVRKYMANNNGNMPLDCGVVVSSNSSERVEYYWNSKADGCGAFDRYFVDLGEGGVTERVYVQNWAIPNEYGAFNKNGAIANYNEFNTTYYGYSQQDVNVVVGAKCPDSLEEKWYGVMYYELEVTNLKSDVVIARYLEAGNWYCQEV